MYTQPLFEFIEIWDKRLDEWSAGKMSKNEQILARTVKLNEEIGELCNEVLAFNGDQRKEKLSEHNEETLGDEFADVIITTLLLAKKMGVNIEDALTKKMEKINRR